MSNDIIELLDTFETQLTEEAYDDAEETLQTLADRFRAAGNENTRMYVRTLAATERVDEENVLSAYAESATTIDLQQSQFLLQAGSFLSAPDALDREEVLSLVETLKEAESTLATRRQQAESTLQSVTVPPRPTILQVDGNRRFPVDTAVELSVPVANVGDESTDNLTLTVSSGDLLAIDDERYDIGALSADSEQTATVAVTGQTAGAGTLTLELTADSTVVDTKTVTIAVRGENSADTATTTAEPTSTDTTGDGDGLLPLIGGASLGALGGGAALYKYVSGDDASESGDTRDSI